MLEIFTYLFIQKALISGIAISIACSMLGLFLVVKRYALFGDAISHIALSGVSIGIFLNVYPLWTSIITSTIASLGIIRLRKSTKLHGDTIISILLLSGVAFAVMLISISNGFTSDLFSYLFGNILLISNEDFITALIASSIIIASILILKDRLYYIAINLEQAKLSGIKVDLIEYIFMILASVIAIVAIRLVGILLVSSIIVLPNAASLMLGKGFKFTMLASIIISVTSVVIGIISSYYLDIAPSSMIVIIGLVILLGIVIKNSYISKKGFILNR
ncbi:MAG: metal ABC transporter permease [Candidatus Nitrosocaldaceae archaeon]